MQDSIRAAVITPQGPAVKACLEYFILKSIRKGLLTLNGTSKLSEDLLVLIHASADEWTPLVL